MERIKEVNIQLNHLVTRVDAFTWPSQRLTALRQEADNAVARAEEAEAKNKKMEQVLLEKDQEITSLQHKLSVMDGDLEKAENKLAAAKTAQEEGDQSKTINEGLQRKIQLLEEELDAADKNLKDAMEKCVLIDPVLCDLANRVMHRLRQVDVKAEHFERQVQRLEQERDQWEKKYEEAQTKYRESKAELDDLVANMEGL
ncbi:uncharacterized protein FIBRA_01711 [Fibroporia radiculosa]|uniref:Uncharacterized protein n=1 Tax=Fibroporia radiculosa TaxID=599839 RepID=J4GL39_9APHY|nr:uncharacterized protein FIBRA_01711 [Fibroporia radiculosa]CCL99690.1 predicted protein [Fibroporia radiculosa]